MAGNKKSSGFSWKGMFWIAAIWVLAAIWQVGFLLLAWDLGENYLMAKAVFDPASSPFNPIRLIFGLAIFFSSFGFTLCLRVGEETDPKLKSNRMWRGGLCLTIGLAIWLFIGLVSLRLSYDGWFEFLGTVALSCLASAFICLSFFYYALERQYKRVVGEDKEQVTIQVRRIASLKKEKERLSLELTAERKARARAEFSLRFDEEVIGEFVQFLRQGETSLDFPPGHPLRGHPLVDAFLEFLIAQDEQC